MTDDPAMSGSGADISAAPVTALRCAACGADLLEGASFCEVCGAPLSGATPLTGAVSSDGRVVAGGHAVAAPDAGLLSAGEPAAAGEPASASCASCGGVIATDGYCETCGARGVSERDHFEEQPAPWVGGTCDRGIRHQRNEDAMALAVLDAGRQVAVLVVCDGVSSSTDPDVASLAAARAARDVLAGSPILGLDSPAPDAGVVVDRTLKAVDAAQSAVVAVTRDTSAPAPPSCTIVTAVVDGGQLVLGWVGDSRAYWLPDGGGSGGDSGGSGGDSDGGGGGGGAGKLGPRALTVDDSVAAEQMAHGVAREVAESGPQAHAITRWLGVDSPGRPAHTVSTTLNGRGWVVLCSDGLWNYCSEADDLAALVGGLAIPQRSPLDLSRALVDWAKEQGGHDNITVALARI